MRTLSNDFLRWRCVSVSCRLQQNQRTRLQEGRHRSELCDCIILLFIRPISDAVLQTAHLPPSAPTPHVQFLNSCEIYSWFGCRDVTPSWRILQHWFCVIPSDLINDGIYFSAFLLAISTFGWTYHPRCKRKDNVTEKIPSWVFYLDKGYYTMAGHALIATTGQYSY